MEHKAGCCPSKPVPPSLENNQIRPVLPVLPTPIPLIPPSDKVRKSPPKPIPSQIISSIVNPDHTHDVKHPAVSHCKLMPRVGWWLTDAVHTHPPSQQLTPQPLSHASAPYDPPRQPAHSSAGSSHHSAPPPPPPVPQPKPWYPAPEASADAAAAAAAAAAGAERGSSQCRSSCGPGAAAGRSTAAGSPAGTGRGRRCAQRRRCGRARRRAGFVGSRSRRGVRGIWR